MEEFRAYSLNTGGRYSPATNTWMSTAATIDDTYARDRHTAVWTGTQMIIWGGIQTYIYSLGYYEDYSFYLNNGACYNPATNMWMPTTETGAPSTRFEHTAVWTGTQMIVWGGGATVYDGHELNTGALYSP